MVWYELERPGTIHRYGTPLHSGARALTSRICLLSLHAVCPAKTSRSIGAQLIAVLAMYRQSKGKALLIAEIALPLVSDIANPKDERYPVKSVVDGAVVGELRLSVAFHEIKRLPFDRYMVRQVRPRRPAVRNVTVS
jgi:hypothetical protein